MKYLKTKGLTNDEIQLLREKYLGASEIGIALGLNYFRTPNNLWREKVHAPGFIRFKGNELTKWGSRLEDSIAKGFAEDYKCKVQRDNKIRIDERSNILSCSLDRIVHMDGKEGPGILEIKNIGQYRFDKLRKTQEDIPLTYYCQHQQQFYVTGYTWGFFVMLVGGNNLIVKEMIPDIKFQEQQASYAVQWWKEFVQKKKEPPLKAVDLSDTDTIKLDQEGIFNTDDKNYYDLHQEYMKIKEDIKKLEKRKDEIKEDMTEAIGRNKELRYCGSTLIKWKEYQMFDQSKFKEENSDLFNKYKTKTVRSLDFKEFVYENNN